MTGPLSNRVVDSPSIFWFMLPVRLWWSTVSSQPTDIALSTLIVVRHVQCWPLLKSLSVLTPESINCSTLWLTSPINLALAALVSKDRVVIPIPSITGWCVYSTRTLISPYSTLCYKLRFSCSCEIRAFEIKFIGEFNIRSIAIWIKTLK